MKKPPAKPRQTRARRKPGPRKGDGGRKPIPLLQDPDRFILMMDYWRTTVCGRRGYKDEHTIEWLRMFDLVFTPMELVEVNSNPGGFSLINIAGERRPRSNAAARGRPGLLLSPHNSADESLWESRQKRLQENLKAFHSKKLTNPEQYWVRVSLMGLSWAATPAHENKGLVMLAHAGWTFPPAAGHRIAKILREMRPV